MTSFAPLAFAAPSAGFFFAWYPVIGRDVLLDLWWDGWTAIGRSTCELEWLASLRWKEGAKWFGVGFKFILSVWWVGGSTSSRAYVEWFLVWRSGWAGVSCLVKPSYQSGVQALAMLVPCLSVEALLQVIQGSDLQPRQHWYEQLVRFLGASLLLDETKRVLHRLVRWLCHSSKSIKWKCRAIWWTRLSCRSRLRYRG